MKKSVLLTLALIAFCSQIFAQEPGPQETARNFMRSGDFDNAILVLNRALQNDANNMELQKDLTLSYFYKRDFANAKTAAETLINNENADIIAYQIAGNVYKALEETKDADRMYRKALKKFPKSGPLYSEYGELLMAKKDLSAIDQWEKGIEVDPAFSGNYYNAALYYSNNTKDKVWALLYGEIFVNMESLSPRGAAMKKLLLDTYKEKLFADADMMKGQNGKNEFAKAWLQSMSRQSSLLNKGVNTEILTMIRTRFILDWYANNGNKFPFKLFDYQQQLIREGMFDSYNQWLFGTVENLSAYENWTKGHNEEYSKFTTFQKGRIFKMPVGQYYH